MAEQFDSIARAEGQEQLRIIEQLASRPAEALASAVQALEAPPKSRWGAAVAVIRAIGYPRNADAIPVLVAHLGDPNWPGWDEAVATLGEIGPEVVAPYLIEVLLDHGRHRQHWADDVEGICYMLGRVDRTFSLSCGPAVAFLLAATCGQETPDPSLLLNVLRRIGGDAAAYAVPSLLELRHLGLTPEIRSQCDDLINLFSEQVLSPYSRMLREVP